MKKIILSALFFLLPAAVLADNYKFSPDGLKEINVVLDGGKVNIGAFAAEEISVKILPPSKDGLGRIVNTDDGKLSILLDDSAVNENAFVDIKLPKGNSTVYINSKKAEISASGINGFLSIEANSGSANIDKLNGDLYLSVIETKIKANGIFKSLDIENENADIEITLNNLPPGLHYYDVHGSGNIIFRLGKTVKKEKLKVGRSEFNGNLRIE
ncbi:MAG: hypothetical protein LBQ47_05655 [Endomicrobium sp.]|jgi:hypothetical protein|nr:hypothetical protein [Endomicrobium sp.]